MAPKRKIKGRKSALRRRAPAAPGRRPPELRPNLDIPDLGNILRDVIETLGTREQKVTDKESPGYSLRVCPYRTTDNKIDGAVITLVDLEGKKGNYAGKTPHRAK